jgi:hypothetical protein
LSGAVTPETALTIINFFMASGGKESKLKYLTKFALFFSSDQRQEFLMFCKTQPKKEESQRFMAAITESLEVSKVIGLYFQDPNMWGLALIGKGLLSDDLF